MSKALPPVRASKCSTCPFLKGSPHAYLAPDLAESALKLASRICHQTGANNAFHRHTGRPEALCRGARDIQLGYFHSVGFLPAATDEAWVAKAKEIGLAVGI